MTRENDLPAWELGEELGAVVNAAQDFAGCVSQTGQVQKNGDQSREQLQTLLQWAVGLGHGLMIYLENLAPRLQTLGVETPEWPSGNDYASSHYRATKDTTPWTPERLEADKRRFQGGIEEVLSAVKNAIERDGGDTRAGLYELALFAATYSGEDGGIEHLQQAARRADLPIAIWENLLTEMTEEKDRQKLRKLADRLSHRVRRYLLYGTVTDEQADSDGPAGLDDFLKGLL